MAEGTSRHSFITTKMERMGESFETLAQMMGKEQAIQIVAETLQKVPCTFSVDGQTVGIVHMLGRLLQQAGFVGIEQRPFVLDL